MPNRTVCDVLEEMRKCHKTRNYSYMPGLVEEVQSLTNRMEASLWDKGDYTRLTKLISTLKKEKKELEASVEALKGMGRNTLGIGE